MQSIKAMLITVFAAELREAPSRPRYGSVGAGARPQPGELTR